MSHPEWNQCIECSVVSCKHHNDHGHCSLDKIKVEPTPMAYTGEAADESMCGNYNCKYFQESRGFGGSLHSLFIFISDARSSRYTRGSCGRRRKCRTWPC